jgi:hypothetical protein
MNYIKVYDQLMEKRKKEPSKSEYRERHHIVPRCMNGSDDFDNIVFLSPKEHFVAHHLLYKHYKTPALAHAFFMMLRCGSNQGRYFTPRQKEAATIAHRQALKETTKGSGNHFYGKIHTDETKKLISKKNKGRIKSQREIDNWIEKVAKKPKGAEQRKKIGRKGLVMLQNKNTMEIVRISYDEAKRLGEEWVNPRKLNPETKYQCVHCGIMTNKGNLRRWHNDNCKQRQA